MSGKLTKLTDTERGNAEVEEEEDGTALQQLLRPWSDLRPELLELIMESSGLAPCDRIAASRVCKTWHSVMRLVNRCPWSFYYPTRSWGVDPFTFKFLDPTKPTTYSIGMPKLRGATPCYAKDGWLLLHYRRSKSVVFFNPFTRESIKLPDFERDSEGFAFSCAPTSPGCVVFSATPTAGDNRSIRIHTCHPGATEWTTSIHGGRYIFPPGPEYSNTVVCNGLFYCLRFTWHRVGIFDPQGRKWTVLPATPPRFVSGHWLDCSFTAEYKGEILAVHASKRVNPRIFKLHQRSGKVEWNEVSSLGGVSFFAGFMASHATNCRIDLPPGIIRNTIYLPMSLSVGKEARCISYSIDDGRYYPSEFDGHCEKSNLANSLWIEPPQELPSSFSSWLAGAERRKNVSLISSVSALDTLKDN